MYDITNRWSFDGIDRWIKEIDEVSQREEPVEHTSFLPCQLCPKAHVGLFGEKRGAQGQQSNKTPRRCHLWSGASVARLGRGGDGRLLQAEEGFNVCPSISVRYKPGVAGKGLGMSRKMGKFPLKWTVGGINELSSSCSIDCSAVRAASLPLPVTAVEDR